jgi:serine/threonine-protein kinase
MADWTGRDIGKVHIEKQIARGGMAQVYYGVHTTLGQPMAVKVMLSFLDDEGGYKERFQREARVISTLRHPNIVKVFDFDVVDGQPCIVMEYLSGPSLSGYLRDLHGRNERLPIGTIERLIVRIASALSYAHSQNIVHRDVKPANIMLHSTTGSITLGQPLTDDAEPVLTDFGLVRLLDSAIQTASGVVSGTPAYMSPEQARGGRVDHRSDIYSLGIVLYEMLSGRVPFEADTSMAVLMKHISEAPAPIPGLAPELQVVVDRALAKDPDLRYQSADDLARDLQAAAASEKEFTTPRVTVKTPAATLPLQPARDPLQKRSLPRWTLWLGGASIVLIAAWIAFAQGPLQAGLPFGKPGPTRTITPVPATQTPVPPPAQAGSLRFGDLKSRADSISVSIWDDTLTGNDGLYEVWLLTDQGETRRSIGTLSKENDFWTVNFVDPNGNNLLAQYDRVEITLEQNPDPSPNPSRTVLYSSIMPPEAGVHIHHLLVGFSGAPNNTALMHGLDSTARQIDSIAHDMSDAYTAGDLTTVSIKAEEILNLIVGKESADLYGDANKDGTVSDPGDGYGLLLNGGQTGYIEGASSHTTYAMGAPDATDNILMHGGHVHVCLANVAGWTVQLRDTAVTILNASAPARADVDQIVLLADTIVKGVNLNANETIDIIPGECGLATTLEHAYYLAELQIYAGANQIPPTAMPMDMNATPMPDPNYGGG